MNIYLIAVSSRTPTWIEQGFDHYVQRLPKHFRLRLIEVPAVSRKKGSIKEIRREEARRVLDRIPQKCYVIALAESGRAVATQGLAQTLADWMQHGRDVALLVGGADGLNEECLTRADECWSLSPLTFPHGLVRVIVAEQLYRAWTILSNHPYHRA